MIVREVMKKDIIKVTRATSLRALLSLFKDFHTHPLIPVIDEQENLVGMVYPENLLDILRPQQSRLFRNIPLVEIDRDTFDLEYVPSMGDLIIVDDIMDANLVHVGADDPLEKAYKYMRLHKKERLPVVDDQGKLIGIVGIFDVIWRMFKEKGIA